MGVLFRQTNQGYFNSKGWDRTPLHLFSQMTPVVKGVNKK